MPIKTVLLDDESHVIELLTDYCSNLIDIELVASYSHSVDALQYVNTHDVDLIISDINMPLISGIEFAQALTKNVKVIFITAHSEFAVDAFDLDVVDYIVKPVLLPRFIKAISKAKNLIKSQPQRQQSTTINNRYIFVKDGGVKKRILLDDILFLQAQGDYTEINLHQGKQLLLGTLSSFQHSLPENEFIRIHRSTVINKSKVDSVNKDHLYIGDTDLTIGKTYRGIIDTLF